MSNSAIEIFTDAQTRHLYANDASMYEDLPKGVAFPRSAADIRQLVKKANQESFSITPRSAGTSLAGQATGDGVIMDVSRHMTSLLNLDPNQKTAHIQPGVIRDTLNREAAKHQLLFGPDTATTNRCMLGGMIGNNSCGSFSIKHKTTREHILEIEAVLSDGSMAVFKPLSPEELEEKLKLSSLEGDIYRGIIKLIRENRNQILEAYPHPEIIRRNTGYALDKLCNMQPFEENGRPFNMAELLCGSEGTLAITASAKVNLVELDPHRTIVIPHFSDLHKAMEATTEAVKMEPAAVELVDHIILDATKDNIEQRKNRFFLEGNPRYILIIQFEGKNQKELVEKAKTLSKKLVANSFATCAPVVQEPAKIDCVWELRKAGLGLLMGLGSDERSPSFCEDTAVRVQDLPDYVDDFRRILEKYNTNCVFYAHASVGELHLRPVIDISKPEGIQKMKSMADDIADLVKKYRGSLSGEHGDGRARAPYIPKVLGEKMMPLLKKVKEIWDPNYLFNPGKIVDPAPMNEDLRVTPAQTSNEISTRFKWRKENGFTNALELCNGAGVCRKLAESGGTMCPSYMATKDEKDSTRGRANLFRQLFAGKRREAFQSEELKDALDLCLSCKACKSECPANVDMAKMKAEFMQGWHEKNGISLKERFFGQAASLYKLAAMFPRLSNYLIQSPLGKELLKQLVNIHPKRDLPPFVEVTFRQWFRNHSPIDTNAPKVALLIDPFTNYHNPGIGQAAVEILEQLGYQVVLPDIEEIGRPQLSKGMVHHAKHLVEQNIPKLFGYADQEIPLIGLEPSEILTLRDEYLDLCEDQQLQEAQRVADLSFQFEEFLCRELKHHPQKKELFYSKNNTVYLHGHCHTKALTGNEPTLEALAKTGFEVQEMQTGCCGMAGSFGYESNHFEVSMDIGELTLFPELRKLTGESLICAPGFSCRHQISDGTGRKAHHPATLIQKALKNR